MGLRKLFFRIFLLAIPFLGILAFYIISDPYSIIFSSEWPLRKIRLESSRDFILTEKFRNTFAEGKFDSYIFGNSKTYFYDENEWRQYIGADARTFCWGAPGESLYNIRKKLEMIVENGGDVKNALLIIDYRIINNTRNEGADFQNPGSMHHPSTSTISYLRFEQQYFTYYLSDLMFFRHMDYTLSGKFKPYMKGYIPDAEEQLALGTNLQVVRDWGSYNQNAETASDSVHTVLPPFDSQLIHSGAFQDSLLREDDLEDLAAIMNIFRSQQTNYKIVIGPLLDGSGINPANLSTFRLVFGNEHVYDFSQDTLYSGRPQYYLDDKVHYVTRVADQVLNDIYPE